MPITYRKNKQAPLTIEEMDENFHSLDKRLTALETTPFVGESIKEIKQEEEFLTIIGTFGTTFGPFKLPKYLPTLRGEWKENIHYIYGEWVKKDNNLFFCCKNHFSTNFSEQADFWQLLIEGERISAE